MSRPFPLLASRLDAAALLVLAFAFPGMAVLLPLAVVPLMLAVAAACLLAEWLAGAGFSRPRPAVALAGSAFAGWALLSALWSIEPATSLQTWARVMPTLAAGGFLILHAGRAPAALRRRLGAWLLAGVAVAAGLMLVEGAFGRPINLFLAGLVDQLPESGAFRLYRMNRGAVALAILVWPAAAALAARLPRGRRWLALLLPLATIGLLTGFVSASAIVGCTLGLAAALAAAAAPRLVARSLLGGLAVVALVMPLVGKGMADLGLVEREGLDFSWRHRVFIWDYTAGQIAERPLLGFGFDASRSLAKPEAPRFDETHEALPLHPHNAPLQVWVELGLVGLLLGGALLLLALARLRRAPPLTAALDMGLGVSLTVIGLVAYGIWQYHWLTVPLVGAALLRAVGPPEEEAR